MRAVSGYAKALVHDDVDKGLTVTASSHYPSLIAQPIMLTEGRWYYEAKLIGFEVPAGGCSLGWADHLFFADFTAKQGAGDDNHSWAYSCPRGPKFRTAYVTKGKAVDTPLKWKNEDVIGCGIDLIDGANIVSFFLNGESLDLSDNFKQIQFSNYLTPVFSVSKGYTLKINLGDSPFAFAPPSPDYQAVLLSLI